MRRSRRPYKWVRSLTLIILFVGVRPATVLSQVQSNFHFTGQFQDGYVPDSVILYIWDTVISENKKQFAPHRTLGVPVENGIFQCQTSVVGTSYMSVGWGRFSGSPQFYLQLYQVNSSDSIHAMIDYVDSASFSAKNDQGQDQCMNCYRFIFKGRGSEKYKAQQEVEKSFEPLYTEWHQTHSEAIQKANNVIKGVMITAQQGDYFSGKMTDILHRYKKNIPPASYEQMEADILSRSWLVAFSEMSYAISGAGHAVNFNELKKNVEQVAVRATEKLKQFADSVLERSPYYSELRILQARIGNSAERPVNTFHRILKENPGSLQEKIITNFIFNNESTWYTRDRSEIMTAALKLVKRKSYLTALAQMDKTNKGAGVYDFALPDTSGKIIRLSEFKGKVVFIDFWFVGCAGCSEYYQSTVSKVEEHFRKNKDVVFITISIDVDKQKWLDGINSGKYTSKEVINVHTFPSGFNHPVIHQFSVNSYPHPLLLDREGKVFSNSDKELRQDGVAGLTARIQEALSR